MATKQAKADQINQVIASPRNELAREKGVRAYVREDGKLRYVDSAKGYERRISFSELLGYLHGEDIRALRGVA